MSKRILSNYIITAILFLAFIILTILVRNVDVKPIGPESSLVGFSLINGFLFELFGINLIWHTVTNYLGIVAIVVAICFALLGIVQLMKNKSIRKMDFRILLLGAFYLIVIAVYLFFEFAIVNYRPIIISSGLEASYPSSHTMIVSCIMVTAMMQFPHLFKRRLFLVLADLFSVMVILVTIFGRIISGVHWFTDILGGLLLSSALVMLYYSLMKHLEHSSARKKEDNQKNMHL